MVAISSIVSPIMSKAIPISIVGLSLSLPLAIESNSMVAISSIVSSIMSKAIPISVVGLGLSLPLGHMDGSSRVGNIAASSSIAKSSRDSSRGMASNGHRGRRGDTGISTIDSMVANAISSIEVGISLSLPLAVVSKSSISSIVSMAIAKTIPISIVGLSLSLSLPLAVVSKSSITSIVSMAEAIAISDSISVVGISLGFGLSLSLSLRLSDGKGRKGEEDQHLHPGCSRPDDKLSH